MSKEELEKQYEDLIIKYDKKVMKLEYIIQKAIEYINKTQMGEGYKKELLEILGDKE